MSARSIVAAIVCGMFVSTAGMAQNAMVFPNKDQSKEQQRQDEGSCAIWAKGESGFDPASPPQSSPPPQQQTTTAGVGRTAARGAALGQVIGGNSRSTKRGAAAGALVGGMRRSDAKRQQQADVQRWEEEQNRLYQEGLNRYNRAYAACMEGKNYTVR